MLGLRNSVRRCMRLWPIAKPIVRFNFNLPTSLSLHTQPASPLVINFPPQTAPSRMLMSAKDTSTDPASPVWFSSPPYSQPPNNDRPFVRKYSATCFCKRIQFHVSEDPTNSKLCDCSKCMKLHSAPTQWTAIFPKAAVCFTSESLKWIRFYEPATDSVHSGDSRSLPCKLQCKHCGTWVADEAHDIFIAFPSLFDFLPSHDDGHDDRKTTKTCDNNATGAVNTDKNDPNHGNSAINSDNSNNTPSVSVGECPLSFAPSSRHYATTRTLARSDDLPRFTDDCKTPVTNGDLLRYIAPALDGRSHKGQAGRIGVLGGSIDFTGAPYYTAMAALRVGAELVSIFTAEEASGPIKTYSPELMVSSVYSYSNMSSLQPSVIAAEQDNMIKKVEAYLPMLHALVIGPGLGRNENVLDAVARIIEKARDRQLPLVIDADGLWLINQRPGLVKGYTNAVLTPNKMEFSRLVAAVCGYNPQSATTSEVCAALDGPIIVRKGRIDEIVGPHSPQVLHSSESGAPRRPGGLGDFLSGTTAVTLAWASKRDLGGVYACKAACDVSRRSCEIAFAVKKRALVAPDVIDEVGRAFEQIYNNEKSNC
eukprot:m.147750 g.147750  ORF g.147750 m.147750 type:complete len:593 (+) comp30558_c0_seq1:116-1894(+)